LFCWSLLSIGRGNVFICGMSGLFSEVVGGVEIPAKEQSDRNKNRGASGCHAFS
jgi:hypothetical protein